MGASPLPKCSVEEYLRIDRAAELKSEYHDGEMFPMVAVSWEHGIIAVNAIRRLSERIDNTRCRAASTPVRVRVSPTKFVYPDIVVVCGPPVLTDEFQDTITNPKVIVEILSPSTADYAHGQKFTLYRRLPSFEEYLLVSQHEPRIEVFRKASDSRWILNIYEGLEAVAKVESIDVNLALSDIYAGVDLLT